MSSKTFCAAGYFSATSLPMPAYCEPWPGKTNAVLCSIRGAILLRQNRACVLSCVEIADLRPDLRVDLVVDEVARDAHGVLDRLRVGAAVADDAAAVDAEERRAAVLGVVDALLEVVHRPLEHQRADLARRRPGELGAEHLADHLAEGLAGFEDDVADEPVADHDVGVAVEDVAAFGVA